MNVWRVDYKLAQNNNLKRLVFSLYQLGRLFLLLKHLIYVGVHIVVVVETFFSIWASSSSYGNREPLYTHVYLILFFSVIKNKGDCYVSLKASELKCIFVFVCMSERKRWIYVWRAYSHNFMQCKSYSKSITASDSKKPLCFPCCMLQYKTNLFYLLLTVAYLWTTELTQVPFNL